MVYQGHKYRFLASTALRLLENKCSLIHSLESHAELLLLQHQKPADENLEESDDVLPPPATTTMFEEFCQISKNLATALNCEEAFLIDLSGILACNSFEITTSDEQRVGTALYEPPLVFINHSCLPNTAKHHDGSVRAVKKIKAGDEILLTYIPELHLPKHLRRKILHERFHFHCECSRCSENERISCDSLLSTFLCGEKIECANQKFSSNGKNFCSQPLYFDRPSVDDNKQQTVMQQCEKCGTMHQSDTFFAREKELLEQSDRLVSIIREDNDSFGASEIIIDDEQVQELTSLLLQNAKHFHPFHFISKNICNALVYAHAVLRNHQMFQYFCLLELTWMDCMCSSNFPLKAEKFSNMAISLMNSENYFQSDLRCEFIENWQLPLFCWRTKLSFSWFAKQAVALMIIAKGELFMKKFCDKHKICQK